MVFESMVSDLLNRFIGDYVENLDKSQLKIGIWGGNELDVPFKVKAGQIGKLTLKIPWKNLYNDAVVATLDGLYLLVVPGATIKYDAAKEERYQQEAKQKELQRIEEALLMAARRGEETGVKLWTDITEVRRRQSTSLTPITEVRKKPQKDEKKDTFAEKLATQVIKNLQVKITSIHIRYEDDILDPQQPLSMGVTLAELSLQTTDENWKSCILNEAARIIYKVTAGLGRANDPSRCWSHIKVEFIGCSLSLSLSLSFSLPPHAVFKPIFASAKMVINPSAEIELKSPKASLYLEVQNVAVEMTRPQYLTMVDLLESIDCMVKNGPYRKFRPDVPVHTNAKHWWKYSMNSILDVHIRRFNQMWSWSNIRKHRHTLKTYRAAYKAKLLTTQGKLREDQEKQIQDLEKSLDVFNITLARQQAQMEVIRSGQKVVAKKAVAGQKQGGGFFSSFFGRKEGKKKEQEQETQEEESIEELMSADEKAKLYTAIGYSGSSHNLALPKQYVAVVVTFKLFRTSITVREEPNVPEILKIQMIDLSTTVSQRPGAQAIKVEAALEHWYVTGLEQQGAVPSLIASVGDSTSSLLSILFEVNPEDSVAEQLLRVHSQPVEIIYDSLTVNSMAEFFKTGKGVDLEVLTSATLSKLEEIKDKTATGLSHIIETRKILDLKIDLKPSYLLVPKSGFYHAKSDLMIIDFGSLQLVSVDQGNPQSLSPSFSSLEEIMDRAYEKYSLELRSVQVLYSKSGEEWKTARQHGSSIQHILQPMDFSLQLAKCMVEKDTRMPRFKVSGELPLLHVKISDQKIQGVLDLVNSIPLPQRDSTPSTPTQKVQWDAPPVPWSLSKMDATTQSCLLGTVSRCRVQDRIQQLPPQVKEDCILESAAQPPSSELDQTIKGISMVLLELTRQADQENTLLALSVSQLGAEGKMRTYDLTITSYLRKVGLDYCEIRGTILTLFCTTLYYIQCMLGTTWPLKTSINSVPMSFRCPPPSVSKGAKNSNVLNFKLSAKLGSFRVEVCDDRRNIADITIQGIDGSVLVQAKETTLFARLRDIVVLDVDPKTIHKKAVSIVGEEVFSFQMSLYPSATEGEGYSDTSKVDGKVTMRLGCIQIVYLHKFLMSLLTFLDNFQTAKEAVSVATAQAAEKAASSVRDFAQKSFRLSMDIKLKAPLIVVPQSSTSRNAFVVDLGLITVGNSFSLMSAEGFSLPAVLDTMDVKLTQLKLSRTTLKQGSPQTDIEILQPINLELLVKRNLASSWYNKIPGVEVQGMLKSMNMALGQEDFGVLMKTLRENIGEGSREHVMDVKKQVALVKADNHLNVVVSLHQVVVKLKKSRSDQKESPFLVLHVAQLGIHTNVRKYDMVVTFTSLDLLLHTEALLSTIDFLSSALSSGSLPPSPEEPKQKSEESTALASPSDGDVVDLKVMMQLGAFNVLVCDQNCNMADIKIQGFNGSLLMQGPQTHISARLRDFIVINVDPKGIHKKAISIVGDEVFSFSMSLTPKATEGAGYADTSKTDGKVQLNVGCVQVVYLHKFVMSLLNFSNNFQTAKDALSVATAQAAEKAASSIRDFAQKSFRLSMDIRLKAPLIIIPQSSTSHNALEVDLGLITVGNSFSLLAVEGCPLPAVIDHMDVQLTQLKLSRSVFHPSLPPSTELLEPVNLLLTVKRNLAAAWYQKMAAVEVEGDLKPMKVALSQDDLTVLLRILMENIGEASCLQPDQHTSPDTTALTHKTTLMLKTDYPKGQRSCIVCLCFPISKVSAVSQHQERLCLGELTFHLMKASGKMFNNGSMEVSTILTACTLDDMRTGVQRVTSRMLGKRDEASEEDMIDVAFTQSAGERQVVAVVQKLYLCASVDFLMAVADFFIQALPQSSAQDVPTNTKTGKGRERERLRAVILDPEVVFVANLMRADAPALVASFQCDFSLMLDMTANLRELKVLACPFIRTNETKVVTTVLRPCSVFLETKTHPNQPLTGCVTVEEVFIKISPVILNTVMTITAAMTAKPKDEAAEEEKTEVRNLWSTMNIYTCNYWFLGVDSASEVTESFSDQDGRNFGESFKVDVKVIQVTMESGLGHRTVPLLLAESSLSGTAKNWSSLLYLCSDMTLEVNYFNETHAVWEPLIERVEDGKRRWNLKLEMKNNPVQDKSPVPGDDFVVLPEPRTAINICSKDTMNITVSKCCLNVLTNLAKAFSEGTASTFDHSLKEKAPFTIRNALGIPLTVQHSANLRVVASPGQGKLHEVGVGQSVDLEYSGSGTSTRGKLSALQRQESCLFNLSIVPTGYSEISNMVVDQPGRRLYNVRDPVLQENVSVLVQIDASEGNKVITVRSPLQIQNHFSVPFTILKYCPTSRGMVNIGLAEPERESDVALDSYRCQLFLQPAGHLEGQYGPSSTCIAWKEQVHLSSEVRSLLQCPSADSSFLPLQVTTLATPDHLSFISSQREDDWDPAYVIHLHPAVTLRNLLPYSIRYLLEGSAEFHELQEGSTADVLNARIGGEIMEMVLVKYQGRNWSGRIRIAQDTQEFFPVCFTCDSAEKLTVDLSVHAARLHGRLTLAVFSPYWIVNKTSRVLQYRAEDVSVKHASDFRDVVLFSFKKKNIFSKNKLQLCVSTSSWSDGFSLDTVGSYGCVRCPANTMDYLVGVSIQMSSFNLTKMVTMSPFFTLVNKSSYELEVGEVQTEEGSVNGKWHYISSTECLPLWPELITGKLCVRVVGSDSKSKSFFFNKQDNGTLLGMDQYGGVIVDVNISDNSTVISFTDYYDGAAPALIVNHTPWVVITYRQSGSTESRALNPGEAQRFAWDNPAGVRKLSWKCQEHSSGELDLDECGQFAYDGLSQVHWVSFLDGRQRVLLFTEDVAVVTKARQAEELEQFQQEVNVSLQNLGLSLVNNDNRQEIAYVGITSSGVVWEMRPKSRWKPFNQRNIRLLEKAYQKHLAGGTPEPGWVKLETNLEVNFGKVPMVMRQPFSSTIRRNFLSGIQVEFKQSPHQRSLRAQLHWLQVDNQLTGALFPIVFHPVPPPKSIALDSEPKPFMDVSIITRFNQHSQVTQFKYFMVLVQEMAVKIDQGFLGAILALFTPAAESHTKLIEKDLAMLQAELMEASMTDNSGLSFFEYFHISPIKLHLSLSLGSSGDESGQQEMMAIQSVNLLLKSLGATLTDVDDLIFKLAYYEVNYQFYRTEKLMWAVVRHYSEQFLKQMYVLVLGLDVLGNPFGLIRGLSEGVEAFFYEPFQGAVQGPEEFAEGFVIGVRSLLGHTVGGAAGMVSRITGSVGKGLAAITMDKEYQQKRREEMNRPPRDFGESLAKGGMGFFKGVVGGVTGIVTKPVEGAKKEGAAGFFKGIGKGLVGVVARPTGGIVDMASSTFQGIQRVAESTEEVTKLRPVRLIREDGIIRPYDQEDRSEIKQLEGEIFREHCLYPGHRKTNVIVTNRRVMCVKEVEFVGHFNKEWECLFEHFSRPPYVEGGDLMIYCKKLCEAIEQAQSAQRQHRMVKQKSQRFLKLGDKC
uniref:Vacuolar protein sorting 13 homolog C n=1 Tax=Oncorhynchus mykiss TaxID=8022 RepID=A0A8K9UVB2_ONCMY